MSKPELTKKNVRTTLADIARELKLSEATVSRALRGHSAISEQTRGIVNHVARDMGYVPNAAARSLVDQSSRTLGLIVPDMTDPLHGQIIAGFGRAADQHGYTVIMLEGSRDDTLRERGLRTLLEHQAEGVAFCGAPIAARDAIERLSSHLVFIIPEGHDAELASDKPLGRLRSDDADGMRRIVEHLIALDRTRLSYVNGPDIASNRIRRNAVLRALETAGIEPRIREYMAGRAQGSLADYDFEEIAGLVSRERPDALICYDDQIALHMLDALRQTDMTVPDDVAITGFDGIPYAGLSNPRLTTVIQPAEQMGQLAANALLQAIESGEPPADVTLPVSVVIRGSTRKRTADEPAPDAAVDQVGGRQKPA